MYFGGNEILLLDFSYRTPNSSMIMEPDYSENLILRCRSTAHDAAPDRVPGATGEYYESPRWWWRMSELRRQIRLTL